MTTPEAITTVKGLLAMLEALSVTCTVKVKLAELVGVPESVPLVGLSVVPAGEDPVTIDQE
jgi:hypothetical protein